MKRVALVLLAVVLLVVWGCATCFEVELDKKSERLYGPAVTLQELIREFRGKAARAASEDLGRRWRADAKRSDFMGRWTGSYEIKCRILRCSEMDGKYRQTADPAVIPQGYAYDFSPDGKVTKVTSTGATSAESVGATVVGEWSFNSGRISFVVGKSKEHIGGLRPDGMLEVRMRNVDMDSLPISGIGDPLFAFYDEFGGLQTLIQYDKFMMDVSASPQIFRLVERFRVEDSSEEDVRLSRAVMLKNLGQLRDSGVITEEEYKKEHRKIEEGGK